MFGSTQAQVSIAELRVLKDRLAKLEAVQAAARELVAAGAASSQSWVQTLMEALAEAVKAADAAPR